MLLQLDLSHEVIEVLLVVDLVLEALEQRQDQLVEEHPLVLEELIVEVAHVVTGDHRGEQAEDPLAGEHVRLDVVFSQSLMENWQLRFQEQLNHQAVLK